MTEQVVLSDGAPMARSIPCRFCSSYMLADSFADVYRSATKRLMSASCPGCHQWTVLSLKLWRRWSGVSVPSEA
jgi:hypothetical protein